MLSAEPSPFTGRVTAWTGAGGSHSDAEPSSPEPGAGVPWPTSVTSFEGTTGRALDGPMAISAREPAGRERSRIDDGRPMVPTRVLSTWPSVTFNFADVHGDVAPDEGAPAQSCTFTYSTSAGTSHSVVCPTAKDTTDSCDPVDPLTCSAAWTGSCTAGDDDADVGNIINDECADRCRRDEHRPRVGRRRSVGDCSMCSHPARIGCTRNDFSDWSATDGTPEELVGEGVGHAACPAVTDPARR